MVYYCKSFCPFKQKQNLFMVEKVHYCPNDHELMVHMQNWTATSKANVITMNGVFEVTEILKGPIALELTTERCNLQRTRCDMFPPLQIPDICNSFNTQMMGPNFLSRVKPKLRCPIQVRICYLYKGHWNRWKCKISAK